MRSLHFDFYSRPFPFYIFAIMIGFPGEDMDLSTFFEFLFQFRTNKYLIGKSFLLSDVKKKLVFKVPFSIGYYISGI